MNTNATAAPWPIWCWRQAACLRETDLSFAEIYRSRPENARSAIIKANLALRCGRRGE